MRTVLKVVALLSALTMVPACATTDNTNDATSNITSEQEALIKEGKGTAPISSALASVQKCMENEGLKVEYDGRGGLVSGETTDEQGELWRAVYHECADDHDLNAPKSEEELKELFALEVKNHKCLIAAGYESGDPPSEQVYVDSWLQNEKYYQSIEVLAETEPELFIEATNKCPLPLWSFG